MSKSSKLSRWLLAGTMLTSMAVGLPALAQTTTTTTTTTTETTTTTTEAPPAGDATEVVITGSRIRRSEFNSPSPVQIITAERSAAAGMISATDILQNSSIAAGTGQINNTFTGYVVNGGDGINSLSLRGLGSQRTLVMLNGRRLPPAGVGGTVSAVDLQTIPEAMISRYEILKDGASSIYGSDAVAGVVNGITRKNFDGFELDTTLKTSVHGGADEYDYSALWGKSFDKGNFMVSVSSYERTELKAGDRAAFACPMNNYYTSAGARADLIDPNTGTYKCFGGATNGYVGTYYTKDYWQLLSDYGYSNYFGSRAITPGATCAPGPTGCAAGWAFIPYQNRDFNNKRLESASIISPVKTTTVFATGNYRPDWANGAELYTELLLTQRKSEQHGWRTFFPRYNEHSPVNPWRNACDPFFCEPLQAEPYMAVPANSSQDVKLYRVLGGARGNWKDWAWDAYLSTSRSDGVYNGTVIPNDRVQAGTATNQITYDLIPGGVCPTGAPAGCVPLNVFTADILQNGNFPKAMADYYFVNEKGKTTYDQTIFEATFTGDLMELPAGPLATAFGINLRQDKINDVPGPFSRVNNVWGASTAGITKGTDTVKELFGEVEVPIAKGKPLFESLTLDVSGRYSSYDSVGDAHTYKIGIDWAVNNTIRFRATKGTSFRAPGLFELFLANQTSFLSQVSVDPCINYGLKDGAGNFLQSNVTIRTNCAADGLPLSFSGGGQSALITRGGGQNLKPEQSMAITYGFVWTPPETGFKLAVDVWRIKVEDQIFSTTGTVSACYASIYFRTQPGFCDLFTRGADKSVATIDASYRNIPTEETAGIDYTVDFTHDFNFGTLDITARATYTKYDKSEVFAGDGFEDLNGLIGDPKWVGDIQSQFKRKDWTFTWTVHNTQATSNQDWFGETGNSGPGSIVANANYRTSVPDFWTHDLSVRYKAKTWAATLGVVNVADATPPYIGASVVGFQRIGNYPWSSQFVPGYIGRQVFLHLNKSF